MTTTGVDSAVWSFYERSYKYNLGIDVRGGKARLQFSNFEGLRVGNVAGLDPSNAEAFQIMEKDLDATAQSFESYMGSEQDDNW